MESPHCVYNGVARASEIRSSKTNQLFGLQGEWTRRSMLQRGLQDQRTVDLPCPINNIRVDRGCGAISISCCILLINRNQGLVSAPDAVLQKMRHASRSLRRWTVGMRLFLKSAASAPDNNGKQTAGPDSFPHVNQLSPLKLIYLSLATINPDWGCLN